MNEALVHILGRYRCSTTGEYLSALREILQSLALLGLWRAKFFERAAFYGGTALRVLHGLDRFSEDLDFSLLAPDAKFAFEPYCDALVRELRSFGLDVTVQTRARRSGAQIESAFLKAATREHLIRIGVDPAYVETIPRDQTVKVRLEIDTQPPGAFATEMRYLFQPIPFAVRAYALPDLFAGKMHAVLCRNWRSRMKGRDWYDLVWYAANHPTLHCAHLEARMRDSGHYTKKRPLDAKAVKELLHARIATVKVEQIAAEVAPFLSDPSSTAVWSREFFASIVDRIRFA